MSDSKQNNDTYNIDILTNEELFNKIKEVKDRYDNYIVHVSDSVACIVSTIELSIYKNSISKNNDFDFNTSDLCTNNKNVNNLILDTYNSIFNNIGLFLYTNDEKKLNTESKFIYDRIFNKSVESFQHSSTCVLTSFAKYIVNFHINLERQNLLVDSYNNYEKSLFNTINKKLTISNEEKTIHEFFVSACSSNCNNDIFDKLDPDNFVLFRFC